ncbi:MAG: DsbA family protein [Rhodospirillaceae bacterium]
MRNILAFAVGGIVVLGAAVALYNGISTPTSVPKEKSQIAAVNSVQQQPNDESLPNPDFKFGEISVTSTDLVVGKQDAPVTIIEYSSLTCPHCANLHKNVLPIIKKEFLEKGRVRFIYRDFPLDQWALRAAMIARCAGPSRRYSFIETFFKNQENWTSGDPMAGLKALAKLGGLTNEQVNACLADTKISEQVIAERLSGSEKYSIKSTPTIFINGDQYSGGLSVNNMRAVINGKLRSNQGK